jgi:uncharacterized protein YkwD
MARRSLTAVLVALGFLVAAPVGAQARTACPAEQTAPTAANSAEVSDAIFCMTNQIRASYGLAPFRRDARLDAAARLHSQDMAARNFFAHTNPEGLDPTARSAAQGYTTGVGENIAAGYATARAVMIGWMASAGHCRNILGEARDIGVGTAPSPRANYTQDFGDYDFGSGGAAAAGCPYALDLDSLVVPDVIPGLAATTAGLATAVTGQKPATSPADVAAPAGIALGKLGLSSARLRVGGRGVVSYTLSAPATVTFRVERQRPGGYTTLRGALKDAGAQGANTFVFRGRLLGRTLTPGRYRLRALATDDTGNAGPVRRLRFRITGR